MTLLSANDFQALGDALKKHHCITMERSLGNICVTARTLKLPPTWEKEFGIQIQVWCGGMLWRQTFDNLADARRMVKEVLEL